MNTVLTARVDPETIDKLDQLAASTHRARSWLINDALQAYVDTNSWQLKAIGQGISDAQQGHLVKGEDIEQWLKTWGSKDEQEPPACK